MFLPIVIVGGTLFTLLMYVLATIGLYELLRMKKIHVISVPGLFSIGFLWLLLLPLESNDLGWGLLKMEAIFLVVFLYLIMTVITKNQFTFDDAAFSILAVIYVGVGFFYMNETRAAEHGLSYFFFVLLVIWATDSGAYFTGRKLGKRKLWPEISPKKTVEGAIGGIVSGLVVALLFQLVIPFDKSMLIMFTIAITVAVFGQLGDLVESAFKRQYHVKDSGNILPGHGGILDRFDSLLFVLPILHFLHLL